jgi:hypothetical protein
MPSQAVLFTVQAVLQMVFLCLLLMLVDSSQTAAIPHTNDVSIFEWFLNYHINNL